MKLRSLAVVFLAMAFLAAVGGCGDETAEDQGVLTAALEKTDGAGSYQTDMEARLFLDVSGTDIDEAAADIMPLEINASASMEAEDIDDNEKAKVWVYGLSIDGTRELIGMMAEMDGEDPAVGFFADGFIKQMIKGVEMIVYENDLYYLFGDQWYEFSQDQINELQGGMDTAETECIMEASSQSVDYGAMYDRLDEMLVDIKDKGGEEIDGVDTTHYYASLDAGVMQDYLEDYMNSYNDSLEECGVEGLSGAAGFEEFIDVMDAAAGDAAAMAGVEMWIDDEGYVRQQRLTIEVDDESLRELLMKIEEETGEEIVGDFDRDITYLDARLEVTTKNSRIGEDVRVERPDDAVPFTELFNDLEEAFGGGSSSQSWNG